jgi:hypothetical protein
MAEMNTAADRTGRALQRILTLAALLGSVGYAYMTHAELEERLTRRPEVPADFDVSIPALDRRAPSSSARQACTQALWGLEPLEEARTDPEGVDAPSTTPVYAVKEFGAIEGVYNTGDEQDRWLFFGTSRVGDRRHAVFFRPGDDQVPWRLVEAGDEIAPGLRLTSLGERELLLTAAAGKSPQGSARTLSLTVFRVNAAAFAPSRPESR